jgi:DNA-binding transcriptional ArsR family regulator
MIVLTHEINELVKDNFAWIVLTRSIAMRASYNGGGCFPSRKKIAEDTSLSIRTVDKALEWLANAGIIRIVKRSSKEGGNTSSMYYINTDKIKVIGNLQAEGLDEDGVVQDVDTPLCTPCTPLVQDVDTNHKSNLTNPPISEKSKQILDEAKQNPNWQSNQDQKFPLLTQEDIRLTIENALSDNHNLKFNSILNWLEVENSKKQRREREKSRPSYTSGNYAKSPPNPASSQYARVKVTEV